MRRVVLVSILILAAFLRLYDLAGNRPHLTNDEAALGYNAYTILNTGKDEHGEFLPVIFKSFGDWKPGFYVYATVPSVAALGVNEFSVRLPSALSGIIAVLLIYLISKKLFNEKIGCFAAFFLSINPWHLNFSRGAWEANLALTLLLAGIYFYLLSLKSKKFIVLSALFFALTLWTYQSAKLASLIPLLLLAVTFKKELFNINKKFIALGVLIGFLISLPVLTSLSSGKGGRLEVMSVFSYERPPEYIQKTITDQSGEKKGDWQFSVFHPEWFNFTRGIFGRYFNHFSGKFLFFEGDWSNPKHTSPNMGYFLLLDLPFLILGIYSLIKKGDKSSFFILSWLALAPMPSALSRDSIHGVRALNMVIPLTIISANGANLIFNKYKYLFFIFLVFYFFNFLYYLDAYHVHGKLTDAKYYQYGYKQVVGELSSEQYKDKKIAFAQSYDQPYIFFLFFNPDLRNKDILNEDSLYGDVGKVAKLGNIEFRNINWSGDKQQDGLVLVGREIDFPPEEINDNPDYKVNKINYPNGDTAFIILEVTRI